MTQREPEEGWYPDPYDQRVERWWDGAQWQGEPRARVATVAPPPAPVPDPAPAAGPERALLWPLITVVSGAGLVVGSFLPWTVLSGTFGERVAVAGTSHGGDGWWTVVFGLVVGAAGLLSLSRPRRLATVVADAGALAAAVLMCYELAHRLTGSGVLGPTNAIGIWDVGLGVGLAIASGAAVLSLLGAAGITGRDARSVRVR